MLLLHVWITRKSCKQGLKLQLQSCHVIIDKCNHNYVHENLKNLNVVIAVMFSECNFKPYLQVTIVMQLLVLGNVLINHHQGIWILVLAAIKVKNIHNYPRSII